MTQVRALRPHSNTLGKTYEKATGDEYDHPSPGSLIDSGLVEKVNPLKEKPTKAKA